MKNLINVIFVLGQILLTVSASLNVMVITQNMGGIVNNEKKGSDLFNKFENSLDEIVEITNKNSVDVLVYNIQELLELKPGTILNIGTHTVIENEKEKTRLDTTLLVKSLNEIFQEKFGKVYNILDSPNTSMHTIILYKKGSNYKKIDSIHKNHNSAMGGGVVGGIVDAYKWWKGKENSKFSGGFLGQKGGSIEIFEIEKDSKLHNIITVDCHLESSDANVRAEQLQELVTAAEELAKKNSLNSYSLFLSGDLNSRPSSDDKKLMKDKPIADQVEFYNGKMDNEEINQVIKTKNLPLTEQKVTFYPTYKIDFKKIEKGGDFKQHYVQGKIGYTDRVFSNGVETSVVGKGYNILQSLFSDHFGVYALYEVNVNRRRRIVI